ncbi:unnamed protein product, partial [Notodromas monacha]
TFCVVVISAASYWIHLVHTKNEQKTLLIAKQARDFYSISTGVWNAGLISTITSSFINLIVSVLLAYGAYYDRNKLLIPWLAKNMFLLVVGAGFGFYNIYWVVSSANTEDEASFWGSLCGLYWVILAMIAYCWTSTFSQYITSKRITEKLRPLMKQGEKMIRNPRAFKLSVQPYRSESQQALPVASIT